MCTPKISWGPGTEIQERSCLVQVYFANRLPTSLLFQLWVYSKELQRCDSGCSAGLVKPDTRQEPVPMEVLRVEFLDLLCTQRPSTAGMGLFQNVSLLTFHGPGMYPKISYSLMTVRQAVTYLPGQMGAAAVIPPITLVRQPKSKQTINTPRDCFETQCQSSKPPQ